jgi:hypothetical protein
MTPDTTDHVAMMSATELLRHFRRRTLSPVEAVRACLERIESLDPIVNAFRLVDADRALDCARQSEARWQRGEPRGLLEGVPSTVKDQWLALGWPTLKGSRTVTDCDQDLEKLRLDYLGAVTPEQRKMSMEAIAARFFDVLPYIPIGNFSRPLAFRKDVTGILHAPVLVLWNVEKP